MIRRIFDSREKNEDKQLSLRPDSLEKFIGQDHLKENMAVFMKAARSRSEPLDHVLLSGPPGLGKTTFANIIAREMQTNIKATSAPVIEKSGDIAGILSALKEKEVLFIDEIHRLRPVVEEVLYSAMEDYAIDIQLGQGNTSKSVKINIPPFTLIGATTRAGSLTQPLISRFGIVNQFDFYNIDNLKTIIERNASLYNIAIDESGIAEIAKRSRGTPRILNRILRRVRDFAQVKGENIINNKIADYALGRMAIDERGLDTMDRKLLKTIIKNFSGGPVGLDNLATSIAEDTSTIEDMYEPYLIQIGFIKRTPRGRTATASAYQYLNIDNDQKTFFDT
ncbi:MAG TPA: Holliday junction branch migration DNA helicase RuvB [Spirochaetota bacterium]|nr:Holliday junction branch migration DNA helicase RuvB [Spirochaetota bacterium]